MPKSLPRPINSTEMYLAAILEELQGLRGVLEAGDRAAAEPVEIRVALDGEEIAARVLGNLSDAPAPKPRSTRRPKKVT